MNEVQNKEELIIFDDYYMTRSIISTNVLLPVINKTVQYKFKIIYFHRNEHVLESDNIYILNDKHQESIPKEYLNEIKEELKIYSSENFKSKAYFYNDVLDMAGIKLPLFYGVMFHNDYAEVDIPSEWLELINKAMQQHIHNSNIHPSYYYDLFNFRHEAGGILYEFLYLLNKCDGYDEILDTETREERLINIINSIESLSRGEDFTEVNTFHAIDKLEDKSLQYYLNEVVKSFILYLKDNQIIKSCENCGISFIYKEDKKYCSAKCLKASANKRNYQKRKLKLSSEVAVK